MIQYWKVFQSHAPGKCIISSILSKFWWYAFHRQHKLPSFPEQRIFPLIFIATIWQIFCLSPLLLMHSSILSKFWWYAFHRQHKLPSFPEQRIFPLIFIATIWQIFCLSPLLLMHIWCQFFPSWILFEHTNVSLRLQPHSPIKLYWSDLWDLNFDYSMVSGAGGVIYDLHYIVHVLLTDSFLAQHGYFFLWEPLNQLEISTLTECELKWFSWAFRAGVSSPFTSLSRAHNFQVPATWAKVASSKKRTQFKTRVHKPYPISGQNGSNWYAISGQNGWNWYPISDQNR